MEKQLTVKKSSVVKAKISKFFRSFKAIILIAIFNIKEIIFAHKFFLHTFFRASVSDVPPPIKLNIGYGHKLQFKFILLLRFLLKDQSWGQQWYERVQNSILENLKQQNIDRSQF
jgi:hypothetical protein